MYFAKIDQNNMVTQVIEADQTFVNAQSGTWVQTDISGASPKNYAGIGYTYRQDLGGFLGPKPYASWSINNSTCCWQAPTPMPNDGNPYDWDENSLSWIEAS